VERTRVIPDLPAKTKKDVPVAGTSEETKAKSETKAPLLNNLTFVLDAKLEKSKSKEKEIEGRLKKLGGKLGSRISEKVAAVLSAKSEFTAKRSGVWLCK
jgi:NAD-dependent DNA ligase